MMLLRKPALSVVTLAVLAVMVASTVSAAQQDPPKFFVRNEEADLGTFYEGTDIEYTFTVRNNGVAELHILGVRPG